MEERIITYEHGDNGVKEERMQDVMQEFNTNYPQMQPLFQDGSTVIQMLPWDVTNHQVWLTPKS
ncbi:hypothetical protein HYC85_013145 [Camellia sinensis]|uniref:Uncharacterized protein n=1 Tax=Camellia sinensis TaxID=4442 RepID=A0A7J7H664_CAMSI|nr:hypothetical protein HYC85_013145 [Camellia sinensis]